MKTYPDTSLQKELNARGISCRLLWEIRGAPHTHIAWLSSYVIGQSACIVQTYRGGGWEAYTPAASVKATAKIADVIARCGVER